MTTVYDRRAARIHAEDYPWQSEIRGSFAKQTPQAVATLMGLKMSDLDSYLRTVRNAVKAAQADMKTRFVGATRLTYFIADSIDSATAQHVGYVIEPSADSRIPTIWAVRH